MGWRAILTKRLILEPVQERHAEELCELLSDSALHLYIPTDPPTLEQQRQQCILWAKGISPDSKEIWLNWAARETATGKIVAHFQAGIKNADKEIATIAYLVARHKQRQGIATEGLQEIFNYLRDEHGVREVKAWCDKRNIASHRLLEKMGMKQIEKIENADFFKGTKSDEFVFAKRLYDK